MAFKKVSKNTGSSNKYLNLVGPIRSKKDIERIINWFNAKGWHKYAVVFELGVNTGLRIGDILGFTVADVRNKEAIILREQKTGKFKQFPLKDKLQKLLTDFCEDRFDSQYLFEGRNQSALDRSQVYRRINQACEALNIPENVGTHTLRKTFGYHHYKQYKDIVLLQTIFNHTTPDVTKRYIGITQDELNTSYLNLNLDLENDDFKDLKSVVSSRIRIRRVISFCKNYLKCGGQTYAFFAETILELASNAPADTRTNIKSQGDETDVVTVEEYMKQNNYSDTKLSLSQQKRLDRLFKEELKHIANTEYVKPEGLDDSQKFKKEI